MSSLLAKHFFNSFQKSKRAICTAASFGRYLSSANFHSNPQSSVLAMSRKLECSSLQKRLLYTETDQDMSQHIAKEIENEKKGPSSQATEYLKNWKIVRDGCEVSMSRTEGNETITVEFNVNNATDLVDEGSGDYSNEMPQMICRPPFIVQIQKQSGMKIRISCQFLNELEADDGDEQDVRDKFEIVHFSVCKGEIMPSTYVCSGETMDGEMYEKLMDMLDERRIDNEFAKELIDFSTSYEHNEYIKFLTTFKSFVDEK
ncbi:complement component 1 Q subcomponent-binding protein, mitochondrial-like [Saccostrea echinata]|uniref:complement component 1 Q subcomponent-binding protein, mitochondrial-like n=1 Tax=Saccostrea echinata TaxID=191078 RepID=UPI002A81AB9B|nr:complement component 1 Q subcomponent-binding protein, mitochondrial-like [Saccostrea echinata]